MREDSLIFFNNPMEYSKFISSMDIYGEWRVQSGILNIRGKIIEDRSYVKKLRETFALKKFFRKKVSVAEVVSWLDNFTFVSRLLNYIKKSITVEEFNEISICFEYMIRMSKKMRVDYVIKYKNRVLLLEMRTVYDFDKIRPTWSKKFQELLVYKELMSYYTDFQIILYAFITMFEYDGRKLNQKNQEYNNNQIEFLARYIIKYLIY
jgi:hypothetical protein